MRSILALDTESRKSKSVRNLKGDLRPSVTFVPGVIKQGSVSYNAVRGGTRCLNDIPDLAGTQGLTFLVSLEQGWVPMVGPASLPPLSVLHVQTWQVASAWNS